MAERQSENREGLVVPCITEPTEYLNRPEVRVALHVHSCAPKWTVCNDPIFDNYNMQYENQKDFFLRMCQAACADKLTILIYNGDADMVRKNKIFLIINFPSLGVQLSRCRMVYR